MARRALGRKCGRFGRPFDTAGEHPRAAEHRRDRDRADAPSGLAPGTRAGSSPDRRRRSSTRNVSSGSLVERLVEIEEQARHHGPRRELGRGDRRVRSRVADGDERLRGLAVGGVVTTEVPDDGFQGLLLGGASGRLRTRRAMASRRPASSARAPRWRPPRGGGTPRRTARRSTSPAPAAACSSARAPRRTARAWAR